MSKTVAWHKRIGVRLGGVTLLLLAVSLLLILGAFYTLSSMQGDSASLSLFGKGRMQLYQVLYFAQRVAVEQNEASPEARADLENMDKAFEDRFRQLEKGDPSQGVPAATDPIIVNEIRERKQAWEEKMKPLVDHILKAAKRDDAAKDASKREDVAKDLSDLDTLARNGLDTLEKGVGQYQAGLADKAQRFYWVLLGFGLLVLAVTGLVLRIAWGVAHRTHALARTADRIAGGELSVAAPVAGGDELAALGEAFNTMTGNLRTTIEAEQQRRKRIEQLIENIREAVGQLTSASAEVLASATQQAAGAREQAAAVTETVATVDEVTQTADQATQRAKGLGDAVQKALQVGQSGRKAAEDSIAALTRVQEQVEATAENILALAEQAQAIGEITAAVADVAEQTNLLALNAAIEASRAGEHGKGFAVVAGEVKALADQSKKATAQVRQILGEIQKGTNAAVLSTEEVTKGVASAGRVTDQAGQTIRALAETLAEAAQAAAQITASAGQQATGMAQIHQAMRSIDEAARQNLAALRQSEQAAQNLNGLGTRLAALSTE